MPEDPKVATVKVESAKSSKTIWTVAIGLILSLLTAFGIDLSEEFKANIQLAITALSAVFVYIWKRWFTKTVTPDSVKP